MMARYFSAKPRNVRADDDWEWQQPFITNVTVCDHEAVDTGLIDEHGNAIMRAPYPMGFGRDEEWS